MQHELHAFRSLYYSEILMVSVNTNMPYTQTTVGVKETFLHGSVVLVSLCLLSGFPRLHSDSPNAVESLWRVPEIPT